MTILSIENAGVSDWREIIFLHKEKQRHFPYDRITGEVFNDDPDLLIRCKSVALVGLTPLFAVIRCIYYLTKSIFVALSEVYYYLDGQIASPRWENFHGALFDSARALGYGCLLTKQALYGLMDPYQARQAYGKLERKFNRHVDGPHRDKYYLAFCFQRLRVMSATDHQQKEVEQKLEKYCAKMDRLQGIRWAFLTCDYPHLMVEFKAELSLFTPSSFK